MEEPKTVEPKGFTTAIDSNSGQDVESRRDSGLSDRRGWDESMLQEDRQFYLEHLNNPNFDLRANRPSSIRSFGLDPKRKVHTGYESDFDTESQFDRYSSTQAESAIDFDDESPYPEVRAAVSSVDDPLMPYNTFRVWTLGLFLMIVGIFFNQIFAMRYPSVYLTGIVVQLVALPLGKGMERILPKTVFNFFGYKWSMNPGPFSVKEHVCITVMGNIATGGVYITEVALCQRMFYGQQVSYAFQILIAIGSQIWGYSLGGIMRQFVVWPSSMIWPGALVNSALFNTLHKNYGQRDKSHMSRERFFVLAMVGSAVWFFVPGYLFTALTMFNWVCWIAPDNVTVNALFGVNTGLGMSMLTFDWSMIAFIGSPLVTPWWSEMNTAAGFIIMYWIICPILYFTNTWDSAYLPISSYYSFDNTGNVYQVKEVLTDGVFDQAKYSAYSPVFMSTALALLYGIAFAAFPSVFVHTFLWFRKDIVRRFRTTLKDERDIHSRLMQYYPETPAWWYLTIGLISFVFLVIAIEINPNSQLPIWGLFLALALAVCLAIPLCMLQAITNQTVPTQVMAELIIGYILPGRPIANMLFKSLMFVGSNQAIIFAGDLKLGHYMKIPPRMMFSIQVFSATVSCFFVTGMQNWMLSNIPDVCTPTQKDGFRCPGSTTFFTASVIWGGVSPVRLFSPGQWYSGLLWFFLVGAILPIPFYFLARRFPLSIWRYINIPIFFASLGAMPPASGINYISWALTGFIFNYVIRRFHFRWWMRYNYILSAALDAGLGIGMIIVFFTLQMPKGGVQLNWWGNEVWLNTADANGVPLRTLAEGEIIGPSSW
ncbi:glutathione transporter [Coprinopsis cinerea okayama7|uniref:Glutathione transporter n=1 Tax=Coprinopsis cinerea (strain Okayama-7 / 130 / ATCC MYA-4618 / FGSC 9003) TaxID=240176 RepID=A8N171_COPC7|nr:glutathione transporter [Coprinopsis cinerea okayama7\|eukprot:XP_001828619.2 glutathione transporter [Coprinopsis cinerea okayama7\